VHDLAPDDLHLALGGAPLGAADALEWLVDAVGP
jgi:hypothetical protein